MRAHDAAAAPEPHLQLGAGAEFDAIRAILDEWRHRASGIGDDAAVLDVPVGQRLVASTDATVEGVHFRREWLTAEEIGARAATAALSDLAAMAAEPVGLLLALALPESWQPELPELARGVGEAAERAACRIVGGNITRGRELALTVTVLGTAARPLRRNAARPGDLLYVSGLLGGPGAALRALQSGRVPDAAHMTRFVAPQARLAEARWLAAAGATAAIDVSDGLAADAAHLARASDSSAEIDITRVPCMIGVEPSAAVSSGEEYELLVTFRGEVLPDVAAFEARFGLPLTRIGVLRDPASEPVRIVGGRVDPARGHDHLS